ncbi:MAG TPA: branched-chain amino acid ABC transporter permease [Candidatus Marinimicrobia bacterium]|jgi:branched-chain amino acid transport system permease protein|nr:branched-chain amino acid ABC transporter permease [Candidatus Neomarinimicrobiota bacterium]MDP6229763.1 branched-chain amino acid ABC transporter permease [Candidatus Neomarinimicrobiota bacterium]MDP7094660.1 branched-chain amino acid ABC transporter permease [Candidatus Neomarinimicrobiota bacterium]MDP7166107.1 branched-chain amino acid ABC transporter permease [Candidatus Neomarinimicrobiota bacterium]MDP7513246.1 branched-chain amino acid ABC transporter permease [Candidatus Neomarini|tara:strand:- start:2217 stop:3146 length:930 start_codon:yes stop_codon:yes gene_type:complete
MSDLFSGLIQESISGIALGCIYALIALGFTLIYKATEVVNFAQGEIMMVGAYINFFFVTQFTGMVGGLNGWVFLAALFCSTIFAVLFGIVLDLIISRPLKDEPVFSIIMATISLAIILRSLTAMIAGPISLVPVSPFGDSTIKVGGIVISVLDLAIIISAIILMGIFFFFFNKTRWGIAMKATSEDSEAAQLMGIPVKNVYRMVWVFAAIVGVVSGVLLAPRMALLDTTMSYLGLKAFPAAILGGFGSIPGAVVGGIILGIIETVSMGTLSFHFEWIKEINDIIVWIVLIAVLMIRPDGLFGIAKVKRV